MNDYALFLDLTGRRVLVIGAGEVATRRIALLLAGGARVEVIAPRASAEISEWRAAGALSWQPRPFRPADVDGAWLVHTTTGIADVDHAVVAAAEAAGVWSVRASDATSSPAWSAATTSRDGVTVAVNGGRDPRRAVAVREGIAAAMADGDIPLRRRRRSPDVGRVTLIGAGPGDPELLTLRGRRLLRQADVVITDHLVPAALVAGLEADVEVHYAGKRPGHHSLSQAQIDALIVDRASHGHHVVRLKGGDPFLLGRGGEEALACLRAGIPVEVVPGVTSALSVPAAAGIPVTHRGITSSVLVASGHDGAAGIARQAADAPSDATLVLLMGTRTLAAVSEALIRSGRPASTPAAIIEKGWTPQQRTVTGTLGDIADLARVTGVASPAIVVIGDVVRLRPMLGDLARPSVDAGHALPEHAAAAHGVSPVGVP